MPKRFQPRGDILNIANVYRAASNQERIDGMRWYAVARHDAIAATGLDPVRAAGIVAALSPNRGWEHNLQTAAAFVLDPAGSHHYGVQLVKARAILAGTDPGSVLNGPKEFAFFYNILHPEDDGPVTIDGHCWSIWMGARVATSKIKVPNQGQQRQQCHADYVRAGRIFGILPHQIQATTWLAWRRIHPLDGPHLVANRNRKRRATVFSAA